MKYMLIIYGNQEKWDRVSPEDWQKIIAAHDAFNAKHFASGELKGAYGVADRADTRLVRTRDGVPTVTDGPYLESKEHLASWCLIDVPDEARALELAAELPSSSFTEVEVWPIKHEGGPWQP
jgi:hypothetical protein